ncbi:PPOX class F420-dependent oxidoreductase [Mycobacterium stomatepiae]|nr:PPOX class F420-dependent oxidoreductase [Mycobacterium stomatepiae]MCV7165388.1 PPOX class F420-dependent oxidoreductase [Mycobacterium stomatepiae]
MDAWPVDERGTMTDDATARLAAEKFVSLTTFKRNGDAVAAPMWIVGDRARLSVWTPADSWKVKRVRRDPRVTLAACGRTGKVSSGEPVFAGTAEVITDPGEVARVESLVKRKYGWGFRVVTFIETVAARGRKPRFVVRITLAANG